MTKKELEKQRKEYFENVEYKRLFYTDFNYHELRNIPAVISNKKDEDTVSDCWIMLDTETSKQEKQTEWMIPEVQPNYIVAWSLTIRSQHKNIVTLWGRKPSECMECLYKLINNLKCQKVHIYIFNLSYDWTFLRQFLFQQFRKPTKQLNTKPHYPISIEFENGLVFRDALIIAQRKLEKWAEDMGVEHQKAVGKWDYDKVRTQDETYTEDELTYIGNDTLAGVECLDALATELSLNPATMIWTATGIPRSKVRQLARANRGRDLFLSIVGDYETQKRLEAAFHGGYTHGNRYYYGETIKGEIVCYDFASSYPFCMIAEKFPMEKFTGMPDCSIKDILEDEENAYLFRFIGVGVELKKYDEAMPALQFSKCEKIINPVLDNGRVLECDYVDIMLTEQDLLVIDKQYKFKKHICTQVQAARKDYLPRWFTDYLYSLFISKTMLKGVDSVRYAVKKGEFNSCYGMIVQKPVKQMIEENYKTGKYTKTKLNEKEIYEKYIKNKNSILPYQWGVWVTSYAFRHLHELGECCEEWLYSDTDSCYGVGWDLEKVEEYNKKCKEKLESRGYGAVKHKGKEYWLGVAELDGTYTEFKCMGAKRYCVRDKETGKLKITVAGVPKKGSECLFDDIDNFREGTVFFGKITGKLTHTYLNRGKVEIIDGIEYGDSIDLLPCDYLLKCEENFDDVMSEEIEVVLYE